MMKYSKKIGLSPGTLVADDTAQKTGVFIYSFNSKRELQENKDLTLEAFLSQKDTFKKHAWVHIQGLSDIGLIQKIGEIFQIPNLILEDVLNPNHRPKYEAIAPFHFFTLKMLSNEDQKLKSQQISLLFNEDIVLSFSEGTQDFSPLLKRFGKGSPRFKEFGLPYLAYAIIDLIIDHYFLVEEVLEEKIESLEHNWIRFSEDSFQNSFLALRKEILTFRKAVYPAAEAVLRVRNDKDFTVLDLYWSDILDHVVQAQDWIKNYSEILEDIANLYFSVINNRTNKIMKVLTGITIIFLPLTLIAGIYGMNFDHMPELRAHYGYPLVILFMLLLTIGIVIYFRKKKWF